MKKSISLVTLALLSSGCTTTNTPTVDTTTPPPIKEAKHKPHWGYSGEKGAENWATLSPDNFECSGKNQSPINLSGFIDAKLAPISFNYAPGGYEVINNGHTVQVNYEKGSRIKVDDKLFDLIQFHFHAPSENHIEGNAYPLEAHFVHSSEDGELAVVAVMYKEGAENKALKEAWAKMPAHAGDKHAFATAITANKLLPKNKAYYRFNGSLTTPPCSEGVRWFVMKNAMSASKEQIATFTSVLHEPNNRPLQAINARTILK
ncbi:MAG: carbonic anhydrase family protein [Methylococcales bacterium]|nr:carbonic anhydrase family protein [Methylococcales bacterium]